MSLQYTQDDITEAFDVEALSRGADYYLKKKVLKSEHNIGGNSLYGSVSGSAKQNYFVHIRLESNAEGIRFNTNCTCPVGNGCKHAVALLFQILTKNSRVKPVKKPISTPSKKIDLYVGSWLDDLEKELKPINEVKKSLTGNSSPSALLYMFAKSWGMNGDILHVEFQTCRVLKRGGYGKANRFDLDRIISGVLPAYLTTLDKEILRQFYSRKIFEKINAENLSAPGSLSLLEKVLATGRGYWKNNDGQPLVLGKPVKGKLVWQSFDDGSQKLGYHCEDAQCEILSGSPPYYINQKKNEMGVLNVDISEKVANIVQQSPKVTQQDVTQVIARLKKIEKTIPKPVKFNIKNKKNILPIPCMHLSLVSKMAIGGYGRGYGYNHDFENEQVPGIKIMMDYDGKQISIHDENEIVTYQHQKMLYKITRQFHNELDYIKEVADIGVYPMAYSPYDRHADRDTFTIGDEEWAEQDIWFDFVLQYVPVLKQNGWKVTFDENFPFAVSTADEWFMDIDDKSDNQWFDLSLGIIVDGEKYNLISIISLLNKQNPKMFKAMQAGEPPQVEQFLVRIAEGKIIMLPSNRVYKIISILVELYDSKMDERESMQIPAWRAAELNELQSQGLEWQGSQKLKNSVKRLENFNKIKPKSPPASFKASLRPYQKEGLSWLQFLREFEFHGVLADDMGLGKTVQTLAHISIEKEKKRLDHPVLVVAPTSLMVNWRQEANNFSPKLKVLTLHGISRKKDFDKIDEYDIVLSTYPLLGRDDKILLAQHWHMIVLDEAQNIKNPKAKSTRVACQLKANHRLCLSGTPMENHLGELWSIFNFLMPGLLGNERQFRQVFRNPIEKQGATDIAQRLAKRISPFMLRRKKDEVVKELPAKTEIIRSVVLEGAQRDLYETIRVSMQKKVRDSITELGMNKSHIIVLDALLKLRQVCCDPRLLKTNIVTRDAKSAKLEMLMTMLPELLEEGRKILLFSQFTSMLSLIEDELSALKITYSKLTGSTRNREKPISDFQSGKTSLFLISLKAGGTGLNLTAADAVIHYDPWWNPAVEAQATDRAHRIGQTKPVFVYKLYTEDTVEMKIQAMQESKRRLAEGIFDAGGKGKLPTGKDLEALFEPL